MPEDRRGAASRSTPARRMPRSIWSAARENDRTDTPACGRRHRADGEIRRRTRASGSRASSSVRARSVEPQGRQAALDRRELSGRRLQHGAAGRCRCGARGSNKIAENMPGSCVSMSCTRDPLEVQAMAAVLAVPGESVQLVGAAAPLDHDADAAGGPLRRMRHLGRQQEHLAFADRHVDRCAPDWMVCSTMSPSSWKKNSAPGVVVKILARIRAAHGHDDELAVLEQQLVADRRLEQAAILIDPRAQVERRRECMARIIARPALRRCTARRIRRIQAQRG